MRMSGSLSTIVAAGLVVAATATPSHAAHKASRAHTYDGLWSVSIRTQSGPCDSSYRYPARIYNGQVLQAQNDFSYQISGAVVSSGAIAVMVSKGGQSATGYGRLRSGSGGGRWSAAGGQCIGIWTATRRS